MRKDIEFPEIQGVFMAVVPESDGATTEARWYAYLFNDLEEPIEMVLIVSQGEEAHRRTSTMRHQLEMLPAKTYARVEWIEQSVFEMNNYFSVTFYQDGKLYDKRFVFPSGSIRWDHCKTIPLLQEKGILAE